MKINVLASALVITSKLTNTLVAKAKTFNAGLLTAKDEEGCDTFAITTGSVGSISRFGITFNGVDATSHLTATIMIEQGATPDETLAAVKAKYGNALAKFANCEDAIEAAIMNAVATIDAAFEGAEVN